MDPDQLASLEASSSGPTHCFQEAIELCKKSAQCAIRSYTEIFMSINYRRTSEAYPGCYEPTGTDKQNFIT